LDARLVEEKAGLSKRQLAEAELVALKANLCEPGGRLACLAAPCINVAEAMRVGEQIGHR
jgi:hypothetical protein